MTAFNIYIYILMSKYDFSFFRVELFVKPSKLGLRNIALRPVDIFTAVRLPVGRIRSVKKNQPHLIILNRCRCYVKACYFCHVLGTDYLIIMVSHALICRNTVGIDKRRDLFKMPDALLSSVMKMNEITQANGNLHVLCLEIFKGPFHRSVGIARLSVLLKQVEVAIMCVCKNTYSHFLFPPFCH